MPRCASVWIYADGWLYTRHPRNRQPVGFPIGNHFCKSLISKEFTVQKTTPTVMQAVLLPAKESPLTVDSIPVPRPGPGQVLIRMAAAPINPSDFGFLRGSYGFKKPFPV